MSWLLDWLPWYWIYVAAALAALFTLPIWFPWATSIWAITPQPVRLALGVIVTVGGAFLLGRNKGATGERERQKERDAKAVYRRQQIDTKIQQMPEDELDKELKRWRRKG